MTNPTALLRSVIIFAICLPVAILLGYTLAGPFDYTFVGVIGVCFFILLLPMLLRFHHPILLLGWNCTMIVFFLPGSPGVWLPLVAFSLLVSVVRRTIDSEYRFISVPSVAWPLIFMAVVILVTAEATGGIKLRSMGGEVFGGKRYVLLLAAIFGYFAITAQRIPREHAVLFVGFFILGGVTSLIGDVFYFQSRALEFLYWFFPPNASLVGQVRVGGERFFGIDRACLVLTFFLLAKYGIRSIFSLSRPWLIVGFLFCGAGSLLGGYRSDLVLLVLLFSIQFYLEGLHRTKLLPIVVVSFALAATVVLPFVQRLPYGVQRAVSFLPIRIDPMAQGDAEASARWRLEMWRAVMPQVPQYLFFGKGLALTAQDFQFSLQELTSTTKVFSEDENWAAVAGDYHNGPLSITIPFGIWGDIAFVWFLVAAFGVLHKNFRYGDPSLRILNAFLLAAFAMRTCIFLLLVGAFYSDMHEFIGYLALSVSLNGGVAKPIANDAPEISRKLNSEVLVPRSRFPVSP